MTARLKIYLLVFFVLMADYGFPQSPQIRKVNLDAQQADCALFNPSGNRLLYYGLTFNGQGQYTGSTLSVRNMTDGTEIIIDRNVYPGIGWVDSSRILIYRTFPEKKKDQPETKKLFTNDYKRALYVCNIFTGEKQYLDSIPLSKTNAKMIVDGRFIIYQTSVFKGTRLFQYDMNTRQTVEFTDLYHADISDANFAYRSADNTFAFAQEEEGKWKVKYARDRQTVQVEAFDEPVYNLTFDRFHDRLFYTVAKITQHGTQYELRSYSFTSKQAQSHWLFSPHMNITELSSFRENAVLFSVIRPADQQSQVELINTNNVSISSSAVREVYELQLP